MELRAIKAFYDAREGLVTLDDDVLSIVQQVRELYGDKIRVCWEPTTEHYVLSELCAVFLAGLPVICSLLSDIPLADYL